MIHKEVNWSGFASRDWWTGLLDMTKDHTFVIICCWCLSSVIFVKDKEVDQADQAGSDRWIAYWIQSKTTHSL